MTDDSTKADIAKSQWDVMEKEDLIKQVKKQLILLKKIKLKCDDLTKCNEELENNFRLKSEESVHFKDNCAALQIENNQYKEFFGKLELENEQYRCKINTFVEKCECFALKEETANATFACMQEEINSLQCKSENLQKEVDALISTRDEALDLMKSREAELALSFEKRLDIFKGEADLATQKQLEFQSISEKLSNENQRINDHIIELLSQNKELNNRVQILEAELQLATSKMIEYRVNVEKYSSDYETLSLESNHQKVTIGKYETQLNGINLVVEDISKLCGTAFNGEDLATSLRSCLTVCAAKSSSQRNIGSTEDGSIYEINAKLTDLENIYNYVSGQIEKSICNLDNLELKVVALENLPKIEQCSSSNQTDELLYELNSCVHIVEKKETSTKDVQFDWREINPGLETFTQTLELSKTDSSTETDVNIEHHRIYEAGVSTGSQTEFISTVENGLQVDLTKHENDSENVLKTPESLNLQQATLNLEARLKEAEQLVGKYKNVAVKAKKEVAELKKKVNDMTSEYEVIASERNSSQTHLESVSNQLVTAAKDKTTAENLTKSLQTQLNAEKEKHKSTTTRLEQAVKEANKSNLISLEIADYEKLVGELNKQIENKNLDRKKLQSEFDAQGQNMKALETEIEQLEMQNKQSEERAEQLKQFTNKLKDEIGVMREEELQWKSKEEIFIAQREVNSQEIENYKIQLAELINDVNSLRESNRVLQEANQVVMRSSETRVATLSKELQLIKEEYSSCQAEFESYKIRVHSVLKQQKKSPVGVDDVMKNGEAQEENGRLGKVAEMLQTRVQELSAQLSATNSELESIQEEHHNVLQRHNKLLLNASEQELSWKQRFEVLQKELHNKQHELNLLRQIEKQQHLTVSSSAKQQMELLEKKHLERVGEMQVALDSSQDEIARLQREIIESRSSVSSGVKDDDVLDVINTERQEGEGSESTDIVSGRKLSLSYASSPFTPLDQLLNFDEKASIQSANSMEIEKLESQLSLGMKKIEHLNEILNESEATNARMTEQTRVLKEEIRRLERNQEREQHLANLEYTKNVIVKFLSLPKGDERERLVPVLKTLLRLSREEERQMQIAAIGSLDVNNASAALGWSSYLPSWPKM